MKTKPNKANPSTLLRACPEPAEGTGQSPFIFFTAEYAEYAEKSDTCVSDYPIEKYALYPISPCSLRTRRLMKNKAKQRLTKALTYGTAKG